MEELLPFIIGLAIFAYKIYSNFLQEQEKARKRNPSQPVPPTSEVDDLYVPEKKKVVVPSNPQRYPEPVVIKETYNPYEPKYQTEYRETVAEPVVREDRYQPTRPNVSKLVEGYNPEMPAEEVVRNRKIHKPHKHGLEKVAHKEEERYHFDMREAIVAQAILNRPEH